MYSTGNNAKSCIWDGITPALLQVGAIWRKSSFADNFLQVLMDKKLNVHHQYALAMKKAKYILGCIIRTVDSKPKK